MNIAFESETIAALLKIIAIDIVLSGDNAVVIAMATRSLPKKMQNKAIFIGTGGAVILRILLAAIIVFLLTIPFLKVIGGILLLWIAYKVLVKKEEEEKNVESHANFIKAIKTIILADFVMSLDNVVAVAGAAQGHIGLVALGVMISIPIMIFGSKFIVKMMDKHKWIVYAGSGILAWTASEMIMQDERLAELLPIPLSPIKYGVVAMLTILVLALGYLKNKKNFSV